jgi:hypothetical protein
MFWLVVQICTMVNTMRCIPAVWCCVFVCAGREVLSVEMVLQRGSMLQQDDGSTGQLQSSHKPLSW